MIVLKIIVVALVLAALLYGVLIGFMHLYQDKLIFVPDKSDFHNCPPMKLLNAEPIETQGENTTLRYYFRKLKNPIGIFIYFHGNAGSACDRAYFLDTLQKLPLNFIFPEYPGYAGDGLHPSEKTILENSMDLINHIKKDYPELPIVLFGESLGTGPATYIASQTKVDGLIIQSPYPSITEVAKSHYPFFPVEKLLNHSFEAKFWAPDVSCPVLGIHGKRDDVIPYHLGKTQIGNFDQSLVTWESYKRASHSDFNELVNHQYWKAITAFLTKVMSR